MRKLTFALAFLALAAPAFAGDDDPEPAKKDASTAKSGDYAVTAEKNGLISARKGQQLVWQLRARTGVEKGQVAIAGNKVVVNYDSVQMVVELTDGKMYWVREGSLPKAKMTVAGDRITLTSANRREVIDLRTGKVLERVENR